MALGRLFIALGILLLAGGLLLLADRLGFPLGRLPGDIAVHGKHFAFYMPIATCLLLSLALWLVNHLRR